jgi:hypothetical protein
MKQANPPADRPSSSLELVAAWILVGVPLVWGVYNTVLNAAALFR